MEQHDRPRYHRANYKTYDWSRSNPFLLWSCGKFDASLNIFLPHTRVAWGHVFCGRETRAFINLTVSWASTATWQRKLTWLVSRYAIFGSSWQWVPTHIISMLFPGNKNKDLEGFGRPTNRFCFLASLPMLRPARIWIRLSSGILILCSSLSNHVSVRLDYGLQ